MRPEHNLVLTGFMGTGKTTVGHELARRLGMEFVDTDAFIEDRHGPISRIFEQQGEAEFRAIERQVAAELGQRTGLVIATGGRMILDPVNYRALSKNGRIFCLVATPEEVHHRVANDPHRRDRPLLRVDDPKQRIIELMAEREGEYMRFPRLTTGHAGPDAIADELADLWNSHDTYAVDSPAGGYQLTVGVGILPFVRQLASVDGPIVVVTDELVGDLYAPSLGDVDLTVALPSGRAGRTLEAVGTVYEQLLGAEIDRSATVIALGPSTIGDVAGFAAATYLRGIDLVHCPTDLIAMIDTSVGGKVGLDLPRGRNLIGLYKQPKAVIADIGTLQSLPWRDFSSGLAEVVKHGLVASDSLLGRVEQTPWESQGPQFPGMLTDLQSLVAQAIQVKIAMVEEGPFEGDGQRTYLNLGHTFAYGIEHASNGSVSHGEAVAMGLVAAARLSHVKGFAKRELADRVEAVISQVGLSPRLPGSIEPEAVIDGMQHDRKRRRSRPRFVLLRDVGEPFIADDVSDAEVLELLHGMRAQTPEQDEPPESD